MQFLAIVAMCVLAAIAYGILHDQITARVCVEYFTIGHAPIFGTDNPTLLGVGWGILATWWVGVMLGVPLAVVARVGNRPKRTVASLIKPLFVLMVVSATAALLAGIIGALLARAGVISLVEPLAHRVPPHSHVRFLADLWAHNASYLSGFVGGGIVTVRVWLERRRAAAGKAEDGRAG
jgi:hypothetical protein